MARSPARKSPAARIRSTPSQTQLLEFRAVEDFRFGPANASPAAQQDGQGGGRFLTNSRMFAEQVLARHPQQFRILSQNKTIPCLPREAWHDTGYRGRRVLFLLPSQALGNNVCILLFLQAFLDQCQPRQVGVFCAQSASDIFLTVDNVVTYSLWLPREHLKRWDMVVDLGHLESRRNIEFWPVDQEADLLQAFGLQPCARYPAMGRPVAGDRRLSIGLLPLASSPLRTLPVDAALALAESLSTHDDVTLCLNRNQRQGQQYAAAVAGRLPDAMKIADGFASIGALMQAVAQFDYIVAADSGPAHMAKLFATPGVGVYTSAPGEVLQGRFRNLSCWTVPFEGPHCKAPCGLAKVRQAADGRVGCMGSLGLSVDELPDTPGRLRPDVVDQLNATPVPCVRMLNDDPAPLVRFVAQDLERRRGA